MNFNEDWCFFGRALQRYRSKTSSHPSRKATFISMWLHGMPMHGTTDSAVRNALTCQMAVGVAVVYCPSKWSRRNTRVIAFVISLLMRRMVLIVSSQFSYSVCSHNRYFRSPHLSILGACDKLHVTCLPGLHCLDVELHFWAAFVDFSHAQEWISSKYNSLVAFGYHYVIILDFKGHENSFRGFPNFPI